MSLNNMADYIAETERLTAALTASELALTGIRAELATATASVSTLTGERDAAVLATATATAERDTANANLATAADRIAAIETAETDLEKRVAARLVTLGITGAPAPAAPPAPPKKMTATEAVLAANGVKSLDELQIKFSARV